MLRVFSPNKREVPLRGMGDVSLAEIVSDRIRTLLPLLLMMFLVIHFFELDLSLQHLVILLEAAPRLRFDPAFEKTDLDEDDVADDDQSRPVAVL